MIAQNQGFASNFKFLVISGGHDLLADELPAAVPEAWPLQRRLNHQQQAPHPGARPLQTSQADTHTTEVGSENWTSISFHNLNS